LLNDQWNTADALLLSGVAAGIVFIGVTAIEIVARPGFDIARHAVSVLSLGERGWVMIATFIASGLLTLLCAIGMRQALAGGSGETWVPILIGLYGIGLVLAGVFPAPAGMGFPPGTPDDLMPVMTPTAIVHSVAFMLAFTSLIVACFVLARVFSGSTPWLIFYAGAGLLIPALIALGMANIVATGVAFYLAAILAWAVLAAAAIQLAGQRMAILTVS
jgi:hypothetical protein